MFDGKTKLAQPYKEACGNMKEESYSPMWNRWVHQRDILKVPSKWHDLENHHPARILKLDPEKMLSRVPWNFRNLQRLGIVHLEHVLPGGC